ncbi:MAG: hypothetical protein A2Y73_02200 [Chloroflexi bacterium RBG_13_56_8]|nr:MAG: hypothetical protein A2Y73_02200 [Chloroflexi bacterium RBG_13_56_8]
MPKADDAIDDPSILFSPCRIGPRVAPNHFVVQPMEACDGLHGAVSERSLARYSRLAEGGWGVIIVEATSVTSTSMARLGGFRLAESTQKSFASLVRELKARNPEGLLILQLTHSGPLSHPETDRVSVCPNPPAGFRCLSSDEIEGVRRQFVHAAHLAEEVGFDGVDLKLCHGYLGAEMLRPANTRKDEWGGTFENRTRFVVRAFEEIQSRVSSKDFVLGSRISFYEGTPGGSGTNSPTSAAFDPSENYALIELMRRLELSYVNISGFGTADPGSEELPPEEVRVRTLWYERLAKSFIERESLHLAVMGSGYSVFGQDSPAVASRRLRRGYTDLVGFGRQSFADPLFPAKVRSGEPFHNCMDCGVCTERMLGGQHSGCAVHDQEYRKFFREAKRTLSH